MHKSIDIYLAYALIAAVFTFFALPARADFQIDQANGDVHAPHSLQDFDMEAGYF